MIIIIIIIAYRVPGYDVGTLAQEGAKEHRPPTEFGA
jgi:hypothetical protein